MATPHYPHSQRTGSNLHALSGPHLSMPKVVILGSTCRSMPFSGTCPAGLSPAFTVSYLTQCHFHQHRMQQPNSHNPPLFPSRKGIDVLGMLHDRSAGAAHTDDDTARPISNSGTNHPSQPPGLPCCQRKGNQIMSCHVIL